MQPLLLWKSNAYYLFWSYVCSLRYPAWSEHAPYCLLWPAPVYNIFPHYLTKARFSKKKKVTEHKMCVLVFSTSFVWNISHSKNNEWDTIKYVYWSSCKVPFFLSDFNEPWIFWTNFMKIRSVGAELFHADRQTDRHDESNSRFSQFCEMRL
jgi:hypothetical protein